MPVFVDSNIVIYLIEQPADWGSRATSRIRALLGAGDHIVVSDLVRMECRVGPLSFGDAVTLAAFDDFFASTGVRVVGVTGAVCDRAAAIRAAQRLRPLDALHLAAAIEHGCDRFLTHDHRLDSFPGIPVDVLTGV